LTRARYQHSVCLLAAASLAGLVASPSAHAELPPLLRSENARVHDGNEKLNKGDAKAALESYTLAARELPEAPGVQLDRGLALLKSGDLGKARESFLAATQPNAPPPLRADAYQNLALAFYRDGDQLAAQNKHKEAQQMFRESVDSGKRSLRLRPGDASTAWNLELATRRIHEEEQKQKDEDEKNKQDQKDKDKDKDKNQDQNQDQDKQQGDQQKKDDQKQDPQSKNEDQKKDESQKPEQKPDPQQAKQDPKQDQKQPEPQKGDADKADQPEEAQSPQLPTEAEQALDALGNSEENFERYRARQRASRERRAPEKDW
jgi:Ca-activated chloride channel homolog